MGRVFAIDFATLELVLTRLRQTPPPTYPSSRLGDAFARWREATDDLKARQLLVEELLAEDTDLIGDISEEIQHAAAEREAKLKKDLERIENKLRSVGVTGTAANDTLVYLAFLRLYEERREREQHEDNRFTAEGFTAWVESVEKAAPNEAKKHQGRMVEMLLRQVASDPELVATGLLQGTGEDQDHLHGNVNDQFIKEYIFPVFDEFDFHNARLDVLGAVFETLARRAEKDVRIGQFFTPSSAVEFSADLVRMRPSDILLDPCVGTGRYTIIGMQRMLDLATTEQERDTIKRTQVLGSDLDGWVSTIARMNMFIHGDGKSNIIEQNGLVLGDRAVFSQHKDGINEQISVVLTNPPLGDTSYVAAASRWQELGESDAGEVGEFLSDLGVVPISVKEEQRAEALKRRIEEKTAALKECADLKERKRLQGSLNKATADLAEAQGKLTAGERTYAWNGSEMKGGALFLGAIANYLVKERIPGELPEWRGGRCALVVDDGILNTPDYAHARAFIRRHFFVKAVVSLGRSAFKYLAHTDAKTSILYLIKKGSPEWKQEEPVLYAHAERVGYSNTGKWIGDDLPEILNAHRRLEELVRGTYVGGQLNQDGLTAALVGFDSPEWDWLVAPLPTPGDENDEQDGETSKVPDGQRLDYGAARYRKMRTEIRASSALKLGDVLEARFPTSPALAPAYDFATLERGPGIVRRKGHEPTQYAPQSLWQVEEGDIVVSGIDVVNGSIAIAGPEADGLVLSKEFYPYRVKEGSLVPSEFITALLRSSSARKLIAGMVSGTSMRTRLENAEQLLRLPLPSLPTPSRMEAVAAERRRWTQLQLEAASTGKSIKESAEKAWQS